MSLGHGGGQKPPAPRIPIEAENTLRSKATVTFMDVLGEGPIKGLVDGLKSVFYNDTPLQASDGSYNFKGVNLALMLGLPDQATLNGYENNGEEVTVNQKITKASGGHIVTVVTSESSPLSHIRVTIRIPALYASNQATGDITGSDIAFKIELRLGAGAWSAAVEKTISGKCTSPYEESYRIPLSGYGTWNIRMTRITDDSSSVYLVNDLYWGTYTKLLDWPMSYPNTAYFGTALDAELFGSSPPLRAYEVDGLTIRVPVNYDPITRAYSGIWDGTFKIAWTNNPAWIFYDLLTNARYGLGSDIPQASVDKWALYSIGQYCDELVPDGDGGTEPRFVFNGVLNTSEDAYSVLQTIAAAFRGMAYFGAGLITATQDAPSQPVKLVTNASVVEGAFTYEGTGWRARHTLVRVMFNDQNDRYRPTIEPVEGDDLAERGPITTEIVAVGCTTRTQARRIGNWLLDSERAEAETVHYRAGLDHADLRPGDVILVSDFWYAGVRLGGRIKTATTTQVTVDAPVSYDGAQNFILRVTLPTGAVEDRVVNVVQSTDTVLVVSTPYSVAPNTESAWILSKSNTAPRPFRVISVSQTEENFFDVVALFHDTTKYARVELGVNTPAPQFIAELTGAPSKPSDISVKEYLYLASGLPKVATLVSWQASRDPRTRTYQIQAILPGRGAAYTQIGETSGTSYEITDTTDGVASFRIRSLDALGRYSSWVERTNVILNGFNVKPSVPSTFIGTALGDTLRLSWAPVAENSFCYYRIKYSPVVGNASLLPNDAWASASDLVAKVDGLQVDVPLMDGVFLLKSVTVSGEECETPLMVVNTLSSLVQLNVVATMDQHPSWSGTKQNLVVVGNALRLAAGQIEGSYIFQSIDLGQSYSSRITAALTAFGVTSGDYMSQWQSLAQVPSLVSKDASNWSAEIQFRTTQDLVTWGEWKAFQVTDVLARALQFKLILKTLDNGGTLPEATGFSVTIDMPDRLEAANAVAVPAAGLDITFNAGFRATPAINVTAHSLATGDYWQVSNQSATGFRLRFFNGAGTGIAKTCDWAAKGFGRQT
jgi:predicted phage tail protein